MKLQQITHRKAFTIMEVLISIGLLGIVIVALFSTVSMMKDSNEHLYGYLQKAKKVTKATKVLYLDIISSDGNITIKKDDFTRLCIQQTRNSLYSLSLAKVCWVVLKDKNTLARVEGNAYKLPTRFEDRVEVNRVMQNVELFDVYHQKDKVLVFIKQKGQEPITFMVQGVTKPIIKKPTKIDAKKKSIQKSKSRIPPNKPQSPEDTNRRRSHPERPGDVDPRRVPSFEQAPRPGQAPHTQFIHQ